MLFVIAFILFAVFYKETLAMLKVCLFLALISSPLVGIVIYAIQSDKFSKVFFAACFVIFLIIGIFPSKVIQRSKSYKTWVNKSTPSWSDTTGWSVVTDQPWLYYSLAVCMLCMYAYPFTWFCKSLFK